MSNKWTPEQENAINASGGAVLVSAAAGSGKTSVLVERVIKKITAKENPANINSFLIVTFTNAAAKEMRQRISKRLSQMIAENPQNSNLHKQQMLLKEASIGTIHSFCMNIVRENFFALNISPGFRIADESEIEIIKHKAMESTLEYFFDSQDKNFLLAADLFAGEKDDRALKNVIEQIYEFTRSLPFPEKWMEEKINLCENALESGSFLTWERVIFKNCLNAISEAEKTAESLIFKATCGEEVKKAYFQALTEDLSGIKQVKEALETENYGLICKKVHSFSFAKLGALKSKNFEAEKAEILFKRDCLKNIFKKIKAYFCFDCENFKKETETVSKISKALFDAVKHFTKEISEIKLLKNVLDFSDLEHMALKLLTDEETLQKSSLAKEISQKFSEVMVDEYQDINEIQNTLFKMITKNETNIFMVGDVKQSIYKFRRSCPKIFLDKKSKYFAYNSSEKKYPTKIILGKNFRSRKGIINFINFVFKSLMCKEAGEIEYCAEEELVAGADFESSSSPDVSLKIIDISEDPENEIAREAAVIAETIAEIIAKGCEVCEGGVKRPITYGDFCILLRSSNSYAHLYAKQLSACAVPAWCEIGEKFLNTKEISSVVSLLQVINNPVQDVPLIAAMLSPVFGFTLDEISMIRTHLENVPFYFALKSFCENSQNEKAVSFIKKIDSYRCKAATMPSGDLINHIYETTDYPAICSSLSNGETRKANLFMLADYAENFESRFHGGLSGFVRFIESIIKKDSDLPAAPVSSENDNTVKIMSIHKSKGLEFPVCILARCSHGSAGEKSNFVIHPELGIGAKLKNENGTIECDNLIRRAIMLQNKNEDVSEELRVLYVALTRAKQKLIITAPLKDPQKTIEKNILLCENSKTISPYVVQNAGSFFDLILMCLSKSSLKQKLCKMANIPFKTETKDFKPLNVEAEIIFQNKISEPGFESEQKSQIEPGPKNCSKLPLKLAKRLNFEYPYSETINLPLKISASKFAEENKWKEYIASSQPDFMLKEKMSATNRGTAMHKFMCSCDLKSLNENSIHSEIKKLTNLGFLTKEEADALNTSALKKFINSEVFARISRSENVLREYRFSVDAPAEIIFSETGKNNFSDNSTVIQGAMDCAFYENGQYVIIDYKTDAASSAEELYANYEKQLEIYKYALETIKGAKVKETMIYSFYLNKHYSKNQ